MRGHELNLAMTVAKLEQIQICLGHASIQTTERYLGVEQDLTDAPCDHLGIHAGRNRRGSAGASGAIGSKARAAG